MIPSITQLVAVEVRKLMSKPDLETGDINEAAKRIINSYPYWPLSMDFVVEMITREIISYVEYERKEEIGEWIKQNKLDQLNTMYCI